MQLYKAARGADCPLAMSEDLYHAAYFLTPDDVTWIAADIKRSGRELLSIIEIVDQVNCDQFQELSHPIAVAFASARGWCLVGGKKIKQAHLVYEGPIELTDDVWECLEFFARKTYVPESTTSRARGAGSGADTE
ncbi:MAG: hypothetical protein OXC62_06535 [Aestuariivita sp.]|nr:hypothetical protein [Aestuariivita sp.]